MKQRYEQTAIFMLGAALGTAIGLILALLFAPHSGEKTRQSIKERSVILKDKMLTDKDQFTKRIQIATDEWVAQLRAVSDELVAQGRISADDARTQINDLLNKVQGEKNETI